MPSCVVKGCTSGSRTRNSNVILHVFPKNLERIKLWLSKTGNYADNLEAFAQKVWDAKHDDIYRMCSRHFTDDSYKPGGWRKTLKPDAIPTIFVDPSLSSPYDDSDGPKPKRRRLASMGLSLLQNPLTPDNCCRLCGQKVPARINYVSTGTNTEYFPGSKHKETMTSHSWWSRVKGVMAKPSYHNQSVQCNLTKMVTESSK